LSATFEALAFEAGEAGEFEAGEAGEFEAFAFEACEKERSGVAHAAPALRLDS
jgi:hypothetical protein